MFSESEMTVERCEAYLEALQDEERQITRSIEIYTEKNPDKVPKLKARLGDIGEEIARVKGLLSAPPEVESDEEPAEGEEADEAPKRRRR